MKKLFSENKIFEFLELCSFTCPIMSNGKLIFATTQPQLKVGGDLSASLGNWQPIFWLFILQCSGLP